MWQGNNYTGLSWVTVTLFLSPFISRHNVRNCCKQRWVAGEWLHKKNKDTVDENYGAACQGIIQTVPYYNVFQQLVIYPISVLESSGIIIKTKADRQRETGSVWSFFKWNCYFFKNIGCAYSKERGESSLAPEWIPHLAAIGKLKSEFIYKMTYSWLLCACLKRLNNNSFHVHHTGFPSANSARGLLACQTDGLCRGLNDTENHRTAFDQTAASKLQQCCHVRVSSLTACTDYCAWRYRTR